MMGWFQNLLSLMPRETQEVPTANALDYSSFRDLYGREPRMGEMPTGSAGPASYLAGQISGANVAGGAPGPRYGQMKLSSNAPSWFQRAWRGGKRELPPQGPVPQRLPIQPPVQPPSTTYELPESSAGLPNLLEKMGGKYTGISQPRPTLMRQKSKALIPEVLSKDEAYRQSRLELDARTMISQWQQEGWGPRDIWERVRGIKDYSFIDDAKMKQFIMDEF